MSTDTPRIRTSDTERERVAATLRAAVSEGRLTLEEGDERLAALYATKYRDELAPLVADLPSADDGRGRRGPGPWGAGGRGPGWGGPGWSGQGGPASAGPGAGGEPGAAPWADPGQQHPHGHGPCRGFGGLRFLTFVAVVAGIIALSHVLHVWLIVPIILIVMMMRFRAHRRWHRWRSW
jgi:hypothetical protein